MDRSIALIAEIQWLCPGLLSLGRGVVRNVPSMALAGMTEAVAVIYALGLKLIT